MSHEALAIILAAGKGSRLGLKDIPKPMVEVAGKPILGYVLELLYMASFTNESIIVVVGTQKESIVGYCGKNAVIKTQDNLNGNLGALEAGLKDFNLEHIDNILVLQADDCLTMRSNILTEMLRFHERRESDVTLLLTSHHNPSAHRKHYIIDSDGTIISIEHVDQLLGAGNFLAGVFCFSKKFLDNFLQGALKEKTGGNEKTIPSLLKLAMENRCRVYGFSFEGPWISINTPNQLAMARLEALR